MLLDVTRWCPGVAASLSRERKRGTVLIVAMLAVGLGANTAMFSVLRGLLFQELFVEAPHELVRLGWIGQNSVATGRNEFGPVATTATGQRLNSTFSYPMYERLRDANRTLAGVFAAAPIGTLNVVAEEGAETASAIAVSGGFFDVLGVRAIVGRTLVHGDDEPGGVPVAMVGHGYWIRRFGGDPEVVGRVVDIGNRPVTIVGVVEPGFRGILSPDEAPGDLLLPLSLYPNRDRVFTADDFWTFVMMGRLNPGVTRDQVMGNLDPVFRGAMRQSLADRGPDDLSDLPVAVRALMEQALQEGGGAGEAPPRSEAAGADPRLYVDYGGRGVYDPNPDATRLAAILSGSVALFFLIVCVNVAGLMSSRFAARRDEIAIRAALGATRWKLIRGFAAEALGLALLGGGLGLVVAYWSRELLPFERDWPLDLQGGLFALTLSIAAGLAVGILPAVRATRRGSTVLDGSARTQQGGSFGMVGRSLVVMQVAASLGLLVVAGLLLRTLENLRGVDLGFDPGSVVMFSVRPGQSGYDSERAGRLYERLRRELGSAPQVRSVGLVTRPPLSGGASRTLVFPEARVAVGDGRPMMVDTLDVSAEFFETMDMPLMAGRRFGPQDGPNASRVVIVNEAAARDLAAGANPIGRRLGGDPDRSGEVEIVGVVGDSRHADLRTEPPPTLYWPYRQRRPGAMAVVLRTAADSPALRAALRTIVRGIDPSLPIEWRTQRANIEERLQEERFLAGSYATFSGLAVLLACIGLYGLMSDNVARRRREIGVRMALGARPATVVGMILREALVLVAFGFAAGIAVAYGLTRLIEGVLFGVAQTDSLTLGLAVVLMALVSGIATYPPAWRASRVDPARALNESVQ